MPEDIDAMTIMFTNRQGRADTIDIEMIEAYVPEMSDLDLESAARAAVARDNEAAANLLMSYLEGVSSLSVEGENLLR